MGHHAIMQYDLLKFMVCIYCVPESIYIHHMCVSTHNGQRDPWNWGYRQLLATMWILGTELKFSAETTVLLNTEPSPKPHTISS